MHTDEQTDMSKQLVPFRNFTKVPKNEHTKLYKGEYKPKTTDPKC